MICPETIDAMLAAGATAEVIAAAWKAEIGKEERRITERRARDAERQRRHRESRDVTVTDCDTPKVPPQTHLPNTPKTPPYNPPIRESRGTRLPDDFEVPADWLDYAVEARSWSRSAASAEAESFCRYWQAKAGKDARKRDWRKTWQNWVNNSRRETRRPPPTYSDEMPV